MPGKLMLGEEKHRTCQLTQNQRFFCKRSNSQRQWFKLIRSRDEGGLVGLNNAKFAISKQFLGQIEMPPLEVQSLRTGQQKNSYAYPIIYFADKSHPIEAPRLIGLHPAFLSVAPSDLIGWLPPRHFAIVKQLHIPKNEPVMQEGTDHIDTLDVLSLFETSKAETVVSELQFEYIRLATFIKTLIANKKLFPGQLLPSTRTLCQKLGVSRKTVLHAYEELQAQGYIRSQKGIGTFIETRTVSKPEHLNAAKSDYFKFLSPLAQTLDKQNSIPVAEGFTPGVSAGVAPTALLPLHKWRKCSLQVWKTLQRKELEFNQELGTPEAFEKSLANAISTYLLGTRGIECSAQQIVIFNSSLYPVWFLSQILLSPGDCIATELPGFPYVREVFQKRGCTCCPVPIDSQGISTNHLLSLPQTPKLIYVTPSHDPTGTTLSTQRRQQLLDFARQNDSLIVEDDYDNEFDSKYNRKPTLFSLDQNNKVIYLANYWKTLYPLVNVSFMVMPPELAAIAKLALTNPELSFTQGLPLVESLVLTKFLSEGALEQHMRKIQQTYARRYRHLVAALTKHLGPGVQIANESAGMRLHVRFNLNLDDSQILNCAKATALPIYSMRPYYTTDAEANKQVLIPFSHLDENDIDTLVSRFADCLREQLSEHPGA